MPVAASSQTNLSIDTPGRPASFLPVCFCWSLATRNSGRAVRSPGFEGSSETRKSFSIRSLRPSSWAGSHRVRSRSEASESRVGCMDISIVRRDRVTAVASSLTRRRHACPRPHDTHGAHSETTFPFCDDWRSDRCSQKLVGNQQRLPIFVLGALASADDPLGFLLMSNTE
jgi:hypothetical protein